MPGSQSSAPVSCSRHAGWGLDTYVRAVLDALDATERICQTDRTVLLGMCSGGIIASLAAAHLAGTGTLGRLAGLALPVTVLDKEPPACAARTTRDARPATTSGRQSDVTAIRAGSC